MPQVLIFDFDGLIVDTELSDFQAWQETCQQYGVELSIRQGDLIYQVNAFKSLL